MKKVIFTAALLFSFLMNAQETEFSLADTKPKAYAVRVELGGASTGNYTITGNTTLTDLREIEQTAKDYDIELLFTNEKFNGNKLEYVEVNYLNNKKWETLTFGTPELKLLPFSLAFSYKIENKEKLKKFTLSKNKNNRSDFSSSRDYPIS